MKSVGQLFIGILTAAGSALLVMAAISLALVEGGAGRARTVPSATATSIVEVQAPAGEVTVQIQPTTAQVVITASPVPSNCEHPKDWVSYTIQNGDDLNSIAGQSGVSAEEIMKSNCLVTGTLLAGKILYVPFIPTATAAPTDTNIPPTPTRCGPPAGWVVYTVQAGDTLSGLGRATGYSVAQIQSANCLNSASIQAGQHLYLPFIPAPRPAATSTPIVHPSDTVTPRSTVTGGVLPTKPGRTETPTPETPTATPETPTPETVTVVPPTPETPQPQVTPENTQVVETPTGVGKTPGK